MTATRGTGDKPTQVRYVAGGIRVETFGAGLWYWSGRAFCWRYNVGSQALQRDLATHPCEPSWHGIAYPKDLTTAVRYAFAWEAGYLCGREGGAG